MLVKRIKVGPQHRTLVIRNGEVHAILKPGAHILFAAPFVKVQTETHRIHRLVFRSRWEDHLLSKHPDIARKHFNIVETNNSQVAMISLDGNLFQVLPPGRRAIFWKDAGAITVELVNVIEGPAIAETMLTTLEHGEAYQGEDDDPFETEDSASVSLLDSLLERDEYSSTTEGKK
jgi:regulator of protease activity HflC (stomatin/prohibitin superfamily)